MAQSDLTTAGAEVKTTRRSLEIIQYIQGSEGARLNDVVEHFEMAKSTAYAHLKTLQNHGYLTKEGEYYYIGMKFYNRGEHARTRKKSYQFASESVQNLAELTDEEVDFLVENDGRAITVYESYHPQNTYQEHLVHPAEDRNYSGRYYYLHSIASGKAILAELPEERVEAIIDRWGLPKKTEETIDSRKELYEEIEQIRDQQFALADEEFIEGQRAVACTVSGPRDELLGAIAISAPAYRMDDLTFTEDAPALLQEQVAELEERIENETRAGLH